MSFAMARQKHDGQTGNLAHDKWRGGFAPWAVNSLGLYFLEARQFINARAANDSQN